MLPGVELARRRRVHYHGDVSAAAAAAAGAWEHAHHHHYGHSSYYAHHAAPAATGVAGPALAARIRLEEKLRGAALPSSASPSSPSRWSRLMRDGRSTTPIRHPQSTRRDEQDTLPATDAEPEPWRPAALLQAVSASASAVPSSASTRRRRRAELTRSLSKVDVCAVCLEEVRPERRQRAVTRLPCSHKYHSECVLPWLAIHPDCPCCRALVPSADRLVQLGDIAS